MNPQQLVILPVQQPPMFLEIAPGGLIAISSITAIKLEISNNKVNRIAVNTNNETIQAEVVDPKTREVSHRPELVWIPVHPSYTEEVAAICQMLRMRPPTNQPPIVTAKNLVQ